jgi:Putative Ig domain
VHFTVSATDVGGNTLTYSASNLPSGATFNTGTGSFNWTPVKAGVNSITFTVSDGKLSASQNVTIDVQTAVTPTPSSTTTYFSTTTGSQTPAWDVNGDHVCNITDIAMIGNHFGETGKPGWIPEDVNKDGVINVLDIVCVGNYFGQTW